MKRIEFTAKIKVAAFERAKGHCEECGCRIIAADYDHRVPLALGGESTLENCVCLCRTCHKIKTHRVDVPRIAKTKRIAAKHIGAHRTRNPVPGSRGTRFKKKMDGSVVMRDG